MGNRGCLHDASKRIVRSASARTDWIACTLEWPGIRRQLMAPGAYTELFFLDEATALAAGHRPCWQCRREQFKSFTTAWAGAAGFSGSSRAKDIDPVLHEERLSRNSWPSVRPQDLPVGAMFSSDEESAWLKSAAGYRQWSPGGYGPVHKISRDGVQLLTPPSIVRTILAGYSVGQHPSAGAA